MATYPYTKRIVSKEELDLAISATEIRHERKIDFNLAKSIIINILIRISDDNPEQMPYLNALEAVLTELHIKDRATRSLYKSFAGRFFQPHSAYSRRAKRHTKKRKLGEKPRRQKEFVPTINNKSGQYDFGIKNY